MRKSIWNLIKCGFCLLLFLDCSYLFYTYRIKPRLGLIRVMDHIAHVLGDYSVCEENTWWKDDSMVGSKPWQHITKEEKDYPIAYTILAFERPDQVRQTCGYICINISILYDFHYDPSNHNPIGCPGER